MAGTAELAELAWRAHAEIPRYVPYCLFGPVRAYPEETPARWPGTGTTTTAAIAAARAGRAPRNVSLRYGR